MGSARTLDVSSPEIAEEIVKTHDTVFANRHKPMTLNRASKYNLPPSPLKLPLLGNFHKIGSLPYRSLRALSDSFRELFPYIGWMDKITGFDSKLEKIFKLVDGFLDRAIKEYKYKKNDNENKVFIEALLNLKKASVDGGDLTQETIKGILLGPVGEVAKYVKVSNDRQGTGTRWQSSVIRYCPMPELGST
ncbi:hypothetical protein RJ641_014831 [Dillenia turbinata]|uniref:Uncharacterized protein n=1 Tax=Dillenia turbinata TaxID=194707 RepID=A0AAN8Z5A5_9MAGN